MKRKILKKKKMDVDVKLLVHFELYTSKKKKFLS